SRDQINGQLRGVLDEATGKWGIRVNRVELKAIDPPHSVQDSMEKQMRAERDRRAAILTAAGVKQSAILTAECAQQSQILRAEGSAQARILEAQGQARAIQQVFSAIHRGKPTQKLLAYQYLQVLPQLARGDSNKMWIVPSELTDALKGIGNALGGTDTRPDADDEPWVPTTDAEEDAFAETILQDSAKALAEARGQAAAASAESTEHAAPIGRQQPPVRPGGADVPPPPVAAPPVPDAQPPADVAGPEDLPGANPEPPAQR
ncbi:MAG: SPFH domain-containing protein, partial [Terrabacter sp.]